MVNGEEVKTILASLAPIAELAETGEYFKIPEDTGEDDLLINAGVGISRNRVIQIVSLMIFWRCSRLFCCC
ncbi:hypothetical protein N7517_004804 [Penicillium concentricum]|uniref:Uncharacterized protein n=1 Tax=Penicillium concentricum TaxID=293559 RepID=A0A9W9S694_9EURO|nr:uncharacterized protein N7517_004804 [Penicillium concentricum]KAJ5372798.1 hypothetical protein N7517_004804 [Penicillium concentricum]